MAYQYLLFYKPYNVLSQFSEGSTPPAASRSRLTLKDFVPVEQVYPVGRLDRDSEGLMLLTNHGQVQHRLSDPRFAHPRTYWVQVEHVPTPRALDQLRQGVIIKGYHTRPCRAQLIPAPAALPPRDPPIRHRQTIPTAWLELTLEEGKNRQVRRMTAAVGHPTLRLVRVAIAHLHLGALQPGEWRFTTAAERQALLQL
ncbi:MAG: pseudouridine synthase [Leptolyngbya sp. DLM2.Bin27]|nr:MAG: pseudouridine synthase [Leptolyngbya sp. DLM2.Bin27]